MNIFVTIASNGTIETTIAPLNPKLSGLHPESKARITLESDCLDKGQSLQSILELANMDQFTGNVIQFIKKDGNGYPDRLTGPRPDSLIYHIDLNIEVPTERQLEMTGALVYDKSKFKT